VAQATKTAAELLGISLVGARVAIHGFGNVGMFTYNYLIKLGAKVVALTDISGAIFDENGFDRKLMEKMVKSKSTLNTYPAGKHIEEKEFWQIPADILVPASVTNVINEHNKDYIKAKLIVEAGNIPMSEGIEEDFYKQRVMVLPDFMVNAGGVISSYAEYRGLHPEAMLDTVKEKITKVTTEIVSRSLKTEQSPRQIALEIVNKK